MASRSRSWMEQPVVGISSKHSFSPNRSSSAKMAASASLLIDPSRMYTQVNSKIGNFANPGAPDLRPAKQALSEGNRADAAGRKCGDAGEGKNPSFEFSCV